MINTDKFLFAITSFLIFLSCGTTRTIERETEVILSTVSCDSLLEVPMPNIDHLPKPVRTWLLASGVFNRETIVSAYILQDARMQTKPEDSTWYSAKAQQYSTIETPAFIWTVSLQLNPLIHISGRDKFEHGNGEMHMKLNSVFTVVQESGEKIDEGTMQRYLGEMVWMPSLALSPYIEWEAINDTSAKATMVYMGTCGSGTFFFNEQGDFIRFEALRYMGNESEAEKHCWVLTVDEYTCFEGVTIPSRMRATWKLPQGDWTWLHLSISDIRFNVCSVINNR